MAENAGAKQRRRGPGRPFPAGQSGNPMGKPLGTRNRATRAAETLLDGEAEALTRKAVEMALAGDTTALRLCLDRILPPRKGRPVTLDLPVVTDAAKVQTALTRPPPVKARSRPMRPAHSPPSSKRSAARLRLSNWKPGCGR